MMVIQMIIGISWYFQLHLTFLSILGLINFIGRVMVLLFDVPNENQKNNCYLGKW